MFHQEIALHDIINQYFFIICFQCTKYGKETIPRPFSKKSKLSISLWINILKFYLFCFIACQAENYLKWLKLSYRPPAFTSYMAFLKNKKRPGTILPASFSTWFLWKYISVGIFYYLTKVQCLVAFISWDIGQYVYFNCLLTRLWRYKFRTEPYLSN